MLFCNMTGRTHDAIAFASLITAATLFPPARLNLATAGAAVVGNIVGGTLPDIDQASNRLWDLLPFGDEIAKVAKKIFMGHRNLTHSILGVVLVNALLKFVLPMAINPVYININILYISIMIGYLSHLLADSVTKEGLPLLFPLKFKFGFPPLKFLRITTGKWVENLIVLPGVAFYIFWFFGRNQAQVLSLVRLIVN